MRTFPLAIALISLALPAFARDDPGDPRRMAVTISVVHPLLTSLDAGSFGMDIGFEYAITRHASAKVNLRHTHAQMFRARLEGRWYPQGNYLEGWFVGGSLQLQRQLRRDPLHCRCLGEPTPWIWVNHGSFSVGGGYKTVFQEGPGRTAFVLEPAMDLRWAIIPRVGLAFFHMDYWISGLNGLIFRTPLGITF